MKKNVNGWEEKYATVKKWIDALVSDTSGSKGTRRIYLKDLQRFCEYFKTDPDKLIQRRIETLRSGNPELEDEAETQLKRWTRHLKEEKKLGEGL